MKILDKKEGFTLIELLVVITILGILAYFILADYNGEIRRNRVRVAQETVYSELQDLRVRVISGSHTEGTELLAEEGEQDVTVFYCWGLKIDSEAVDGFERMFAKYDTDTGCEYSSVEIDEALVVASQVGIVSEVDATVWFMPPSGDVEIVGDYEGDSLTLTLGHMGYNKLIEVNPLTGNIDLSDPEEE